MFTPGIKGAPRLRQLHKLLVSSDAPAKVIAAEMGVTEGSLKVNCSRLYQLSGAMNGRVTLLRREIERLSAPVEFPKWPPE